MQTRIPGVTESLSMLAVVEQECQAANVEENDYTVFTYRDLEFEHELVVQSITKKLAFIDNQVLTRYFQYAAFSSSHLPHRLFRGI